VSQSTSLPEWNLSSLYQSMEDPKIDSDLSQVEKDIKAFAKAYKGQITSLNAKDLVTCLNTYQDIVTVIRKLGCFGMLIYRQCMTDSARSGLNQKIQERINAASQDLVFFSLELNQIEDQSLNNFYDQEPDLKNLKPWFNDIRAFRPYQLSEAEEGILHMLNPFANENWERLHNESLAGLTFTYLDRENVTISEVMHDFSATKKEIRQAANHAFSQEIRKILPINCLALNTIAKQKAVIDTKRGFKKPIQSRNMANQVEDEVVEALITTVQKNYQNLSHRYYGLKAKILGYQKMPYWERSAPLNFGADKTYSWDEACSLVWQAYNDFSPEMSAIVQKFYDHNWIDAKLRPGKDNGAFSMQTIPAANPFILVNFKGSVRDVATLAHELGHGVHQYLSNSQGILLMDTPLTVAETASVFGEMLTFKSMYQSATDANLKKSLLASKIEDMLNTVVRQIAFCDFERRVHDLRKEKELSPDDFKAIWQQVQAESLGDAIETQDSDYENYWSYISHFYHTPFYVYAYSFGDCLVNALYTCYEQGHPNFQEKYIDLLKAGGSKRYDELLKPFDLNPKDPKFWQMGLDLVSSLIDQFDGLVTNNG